MKKMKLIILPLLILILGGFEEIPTDAKALTAQEIISRIKNHVTCPWQEETVDTFKGGNPQTEITGIATTFLATMEVLKKAKSKGLNLIITHEPTFYNHFDKTDQYGKDPIVDAKQKYIEENGLVVFRFHDHIHQTDTDGIYKGVVDKLGWQDYKESERPYIYNLPESTLGSLGSRLKGTFGSKTLRIVGDPVIKVRKIGLVLGAAGAARQIDVLRREDVEVLVIGETQEWETVEYVRDAINMGEKKALIILGHANSEEPGMDYCADWLKTFVSEVPIEFVPAGNPFWSPE